MQSSASQVGAFREIYKNAWLKKISCSSTKLLHSNIKKTNHERWWIVFCVHSDIEPFLEAYPDNSLAATHVPHWRVSLKRTLHVSGSIGPAQPHTEYEFVITLQENIVRLVAPTWECMQDWVDTLRNKLREMKIISPKENLYSKPPEQLKPRAPTRDPTSPLPAPPPGPCVRVPGTEPSNARSPQIPPVTNNDSENLESTFSFENHINILSVDGLTQCCDDILENLNDICLNDNASNVSENSPASIDSVLNSKIEIKQNNSEQERENSSNETNDVHNQNIDENTSLDISASRNVSSTSQLSKILVQDHASFLSNIQNSIPMNNDNNLSSDSLSLQNNNNNIDKSSIYPCNNLSNTDMKIELPNFANQIKSDSQNNKDVDFTHTVATVSGMKVCLGDPFLEHRNKNIHNKELFAEFDLYDNTLALNKDDTNSKMKANMVKVQGSVNKENNNLTMINSKNDDSAPVFQKTPVNDYNATNSQIIIKNDDFSGLQDVELFITETNDKNIVSVKPESMIKIENVNNDIVTQKQQICSTKKFSTLFSSSLTEELHLKRSHYKRKSFVLHNFHNAKSYDVFNTSILTDTDNFISMTSNSNFDRETSQDNVSNVTIITVSNALHKEPFVENNSVTVKSDVKVNPVNVETNSVKCSDNFLCVKPKFTLKPAQSMSLNHESFKVTKECTNPTIVSVIGSCKILGTSNENITAKDCIFEELNKNKSSTHIQNTFQRESLENHEISVTETLSTVALKGPGSSINKTDIKNNPVEQSEEFYESVFTPFTISKAAQPSEIDISQPCSSHSFGYQNTFLKNSNELFSNNRPCNYEFLSWNENNSKIIIGNDTPSQESNLNKNRISVNQDKNIQVSMREKTVEMVDNKAKVLKTNKAVDICSTQSEKPEASNVKTNKHSLFTRGLTEFSIMSKFRNTGDPNSSRSPLLKNSQFYDDFCPLQSSVPLDDAKKHFSDKLSNIFSKTSNLKENGVKNPIVETVRIESSLRRNWSEHNDRTVLPVIKHCSTKINQSHNVSGQNLSEKATKPVSTTETKQTRKRSSSLTENQPSSSETHPPSNIVMPAANIENRILPLQPMSLRDQQVARLRGEMAHPIGVRLRLRSSDCPGEAIALADIYGAVWICGWKQKTHPLLYNALHIGDRLVTIGGVPVTSVRQAKKALNNMSSGACHFVEVVIKRLPHGKVYILKKDSDNQNLGLILGSSNIVGIVPGSPAAKCGVLPSGTLTEVNGRPLNLLLKKGDTQVSDRLNAVGRDISILMQPIEFVSHLRTSLRNIRSHKDYILQ